MTDVKLIGFDPKTGKYHRAVRGEPGSKVWAWIEMPENEVAKYPEHEAGDYVFEFSGSAFFVRPEPPRT